MKKRIVSLLLVLAVALTTYSSQAVSAAPTAPRKTPPPQARWQLPIDQIIVRFQPSVKVMEASPDGLHPGGPGPAVLSHISGTAGMTMKYFRAFHTDQHILKLPRYLPLEQVQKIVEKLKQDPNVASAAPDYRMVPSALPTGQNPVAVPNDPRYAELWALNAPVVGDYGINAPGAWDITTGDPDLRVAVIDTGILKNHPDLKGRSIGGFDMISDPWTANDGTGRDLDASDAGDWLTLDDYYETGCWPSDSSWHGSHVSGTIAASANNGEGVTGVNWQSKILPVRVLGKCGGDMSDIIDGMRWAAGLLVDGVVRNPNPVRVENLSLGGYTGEIGCPVDLQEAVDEINAAGVVISVSAGNYGDTQYYDPRLWSPANCRGVITVGATSKSGARAWYSNYGSLVKISAPGGDMSVQWTDGILSSLNAGTQRATNEYIYDYYQGTSMSSPHVAGVVSLMLSVNPHLTPADVTAILQQTATAFPADSNCDTTICGAGILNAAGAVNKANLFYPIRHPREGDRISAGPHDAPRRVFIWLRPTGAIGSITINGKAATVIQTTQSGPDRQVEIQPPTQTANGVYDLAVTIDGQTTTTSEGVFYSDFQTYTPIMGK